MNEGLFETDELENEQKFEPKAVFKPGNYKGFVKCLKIDNENELCEKVSLKKGDFQKAGLNEGEFLSK